MYSSEFIRKIHQALPPEILDAIASEITLSNTQLIGNECKLSSDQLNKLAYEISLCLMGITKRSGLGSKLETALGLDPNTANNIAEEVNLKIISQYPEHLAEIQEEHAQSELLENPSSKEGVSPVVTSEIHPMIEEGEVAHNVPLPEEREEMQPEPLAGTPQLEPTQTPKVIEVEKKLDEPAPPALKSAYPGGVDPYREPLE